MSFLDRALRGLTGSARSTPLSIDDWAAYFNFQGNTYGVNTGGSLSGNSEEIAENFAGYVQGAYKGNGIVFAVMLTRLMLFSEARFQFQRLLNGVPGELFGNEDLTPLESPWTNATTPDLLKRMLQDADLAGNAYVHRPGRRTNVPRLARNPGEMMLRRLRPDWVTIILGSQKEAYKDHPTLAPDATVVGYVYEPDGPTGGAEPEFLWADEVAHFAPIPDPLANFRGMSWLTPVLRDISGDSAATSHKLKFLEQGATANTVVIAQPSIKNTETFDVWKAKMGHSLEGLRNAYKTLYLAHGADAKVIGSDLKQIDFKNVQGAGETRIAAAGGVPPIIVGLSEGLAAGTYNNYGQARRRLADGTLHPLWRDACGSLTTLIDLPSSSPGEGKARLWYDSDHIAFLREDVKDKAEAQQIDANTVRTLIEAGFEPDTAKAAVITGDFGRLKHTGLISVQLQDPTAEPVEPAAPVAPEAPALTESKMFALLGDKRFLDALKATGSVPYAIATAQADDPAGRALAALLKSL